MSFFNRFFNRIIIENKGDKVSYSVEHISDFLKSKDQVLDFNRVKKSPEHQDGVFWNDTCFTDEDKKNMETEIYLIGWKNIGEQDQIVLMLICFGLATN